MSDREGHLSIREVAARAGVSPATVSRVLNGSTVVGRELRERVLSVIDEFGYRPNQLARNLRRQRTDIIGVVISDVENPHFSEMVRVVEDTAFRYGYRVLLCNTDESADKEQVYLEVLLQERVVGVILSPSDPRSPMISELLDEEVPVVAFDRPVRDPRADAVLASNTKAARRAVDHLLSVGHRRIGMIEGRLDVATGEERSGGYEAAMQSAGLVPVSMSGDFRIEGGRSATAGLLSLKPRVTALVIANNLMAVGALKALRVAGRTVPDDIALVAIDDPFWAELVEPPLTTLAQPVQEMALEAVSLLLEHVQSRRTQSKRIVFDFELRVRGSCGVGSG